VNQVLSLLAPKDVDDIYLLGWGATSTHHFFFIGLTPFKIEPLTLST